MKSGTEERFAIAGAQLRAVKGPIARAAEAEELEKSANAAKLPESLFVANELEVLTPLFSLRFSTREAARLLGPGALAAARAAPDPGDVPQRWAHVDFAFDEPVQVPVAGLWAHKRTTTADLEQPADGDWLFLSYYHGGFAPRGEWTAAECAEGIPADRLSRANTVLWFCDMYLYESDLDDWGYSALRLKLRVQADSCFALLRSYARVDEAQIRVVESRFFIDFKDWSITRRLDCLSATYAEIRAAGFLFDAGFNLDTDQADRVLPFLRRAFASSWRFAPRAAAPAVN